MQESQACVLVLPCGRSAHLEAGWFCGEKKPVYIFQPERLEPELMYKMATLVSGSMDMIMENLNTEITRLVFERVNQ